MALRHSPAPWSRNRQANTIDDRNGHMVAGLNGVIGHDARLMIAAPEMYAALLDVEWSAEEDLEEGGQGPACPACGALQRDGQHFDHCTLSAALAKAGRMVA